MKMLRRKQSLLVIVLLMVLVLSITALAVYEPFKVSLNLYERLVVMSLLPKQESFLTLVIIRDLQKELAATEEEIKLAGVVNLPTGGVSATDWLAVPEKEIVFGDIAKGLIVDALKKLDEEKKITNDHFTVYQKFMLVENKVGEGE